MFTTDYADHLPRPLPELPSNVQGWARAHQTLFDQFDDDLEYVIASQQIERADGQDLDELAWDFGVLGERFGRGDGAYRQYLKALVNAYSGRGTSQDIKVAVSGGLVAEPDTVDVRENFTSNEYSLTVHEWGDHEVSLVHELAELADPSTVQLTGPIEYVLDSARLGIRTGEASATSFEFETAPTRLGIRTGDVDVVTTDTTGYGAGFSDD
ncbi:hypothetical protein [Halococcus saccharolyticus]|uniref:Uncharacterized protein n=1 Tax=Halococcus saccharolyticus DSM 5350 TaxID=1227455 RepID=M0MTC5_9EURY|nr:hypothetical protein [Halococcus saccharolyticus]EMA47984.1 hypothetical protein C449_00890 [Halococcus saccharolyticus DSM 5350]